MAGDRSAEIRLTAAVALGRRAKLRAASTDALIAALTDPSRDVRFNALRALRTIHHVDRGLDRARWQEWRDEEMPFDEPEPAAEEAAPEGPTVPSEPFPEEDFDFEPEQQ